MTMQAREQIIFEDFCWPIWGASAEGLFQSEDFGLSSGGINLACHRGYISSYHIQSSFLQVLSLIISLDGKGAPPLNGRYPVAIENEDMAIWCGLRYTDVNLAIPFSGGLLLGRETVKPLGIGPELIWRFAQVKELIFDKGRLVRQHDRFQAVAQVRAELVDQENELIKHGDGETRRAFYDVIEATTNACLESRYSEDYSLR